MDTPEIEPFGYAEAAEAADYVAGKVRDTRLDPPLVSVTLGSGLKSFADKNTRPDNRLVIPYAEIPHFPAPRQHIAGHDGKLIVAPTGIGDTTMAIWSGRIHYYQDVLRRGEKITDLDVKRTAIGFYIAVCRALGVSDILTSNAVGAVWPDRYKVGDVVRVTDHILDPDEDFGVPPDERWFADKQAADPNYDFSKKDYFYGQANLYSPEIGAMAEQVAAGLGMNLPTGILNWRRGRGYESPAVVEAIRRLGGDLAGMSTAPEAQRARTVGYSNKPGERQFGAFSAVTNVAQVTHEQVLVHSEVEEAGKATESTFNPFMMKLVQRLVERRQQPAA